MSRAVSFFALLAVLTPSARAEGLDLGGGFSSFDVAPSTPVRLFREPEDPFLAAAAARFHCPESTLTRLAEKGFGRTEILTIGFLVQASTRSWDSWAGQREKGVPLRQLAKDAGQDYNDLFRKALRLRDELLCGLSSENR